MPIAEASAKIRSGPPADEEEDYALPIWADVVPIHLVHGPPLPDPRLMPHTAPPDYVFRLIHLGVRTG